MSPDDLQWAMRVGTALGGAILAALATVLKVVWGRLESTRKDLDDLRVVLAKEYPSNNDFREFSERFVRSVDRLTTQMGELQSELHKHAIALARSTHT